MDSEIVQVEVQRALPGLPGQLRSAARACVRLWRAVRLVPAGFRDLLLTAAARWPAKLGAVRGFALAEQRQWRLLAEGAPDDATATYLHSYFEPTARAIDGLEKALAGLGLLNDALALDLRKPQDYFHRVWSTAFRASDLSSRQRPFETPCGR